MHVNYQATRHCYLSPDVAVEMVENAQLKTDFMQVYLRRALITLEGKNKQTQTENRQQTKNKNRIPTQTKTTTKTEQEVKI